MSRTLLNVLPGLRVAANGTMFNTVGGLGLNSMNVTRDGLTTNDVRFGAEGDLSAGTPLPNFGGLGVMSPTTINPDLVGEIRLILSPVDAEMGRGNSQIQIQTRSGTNKYTGAAVWNVQNTALNANTWNNNRQINPRTGEWAPLKPDWRNVHEYTVSFGGPIIKNKTFFFVLWNQNISALRVNQNVRTLTKEARNGIVRFWEGWVADSGDSFNNTATPTSAANPSIASVDFAGKPLRPQFWPDGTPYTGRLVCFSVFGANKVDGSPFGAADCPSGTDSAGRAYTGAAMNPLSGSLWDTKRPGAFNTAGYFAKVLARMPQPNNFIEDAGDGLVSGVYRYLLTRKTGDPTFYNETLVGNDPYSNRKQLNIKIDQNFRSHRISGGWTYQLDDNAVFRGEYEDAVGGISYRRPQIINLGVTSTLSSTLLNEARFGLNINKGGQITPWLSADDKIREEALKFMGEGGANPGSTVKHPLIVRPVSGCAGFGPGETTLAFDNGPMITRLNCGTVAANRLNDPLYQWVDTLSWTNGKHAYKFGADLRIPRTDGFAFQPYGAAVYGNLGGTATQSPFLTDTAGTGTPTLGRSLLPTTPGATYANAGTIFRGDSRTIATNLAYLLTDSIGSVNTPYWIDSQADKDKGITGWRDLTTEENRIRATASSDYAFFAKDDYKLSTNLTLNLGMRYEYYSPPYLQSGLTATIANLGDGLFGASRGAGGKLFDSWLQPGNLFLTNYGSTAKTFDGQTLATTNALSCVAGKLQAGMPTYATSTCDPNTMTSIEFVGPKTSNPSKTILPRDRKNFGPAIGFAWQFPWFGEGKTTIRGGYQATFQRVSVLEQTLASAPGNTLDQAASVSDADILAITATRAVNYSDLAALVPRKPGVAPGQPNPIYARNLPISAYSANLQTPYTQNLTLSVTRSLSRNMTLDVRYVGTLARKQIGNMDLNASTVMYNEELFKALEVTRAGGNDPLFDQMFAGIRLSGVAGSVPVVNGTTSRGSEQLRQSTATRGNLANGNFVAVANALTGAPGGVTIGAGSQGIVGLSPGPSFTVLHNGCDRLANGASTTATTRCFPENYLTANPQLSTATYNANLGRSNYHALQVGYTLRPTAGFSVQSTYSWTKAMQLPGTGYTDPLMRDRDRQRSLDNLHNLRMNGTLELPIGPNKLLFANASGWVARAIERWQASFILNMSSGTPSSIGGAGTTRYANPRYVVASPYFQIPEGEAKWDGPNGNTGTLFGTTFVTQRDPQCTDPSLVQQTPIVGSTATFSSFCTLNGLAMKVPAGTPGSFLLPDGVTSAVTALVSPKPGEFGTLGPRTLNSFGYYFLDANVQKSFRISETKQMSIRIDATNILNHPQLAAPNFNVGNTAFGAINSKGTVPFGSGPVQRNFQGQLRLTF